MTEEQKEQRIKAQGRSGGVCYICGRPLKDGQMQYDAWGLIPT